MQFKPLSLALALALAPAAHAENLSAVFQDAQAYDAQYAAARAAYQAGQEKAVQGRAGLLPNVNLGGNAQYNKIDSSLPGGDADYASNGLSLNATQPLFRKQNLVQYEQSKQQVKIAEMQLKVAEQDLILRVAQAYFDVLQSQDNIAFINAQKSAISEQLASAKRNFEVGTATITDTREAQARYDLAVAQELAAENDLRVKRVTLDQFVGRVGVEPKGLAVPVALPALPSNNVDTWVATGDEQHPAVRKARLGLEVAQLDTQIARAGDKPTLDANATLGGQNLHNNLNGAAAASSGVGTTKTASVGLTFTYPLYTGGLTQNRIKETLVLEERARNDLDFARRSVAEATRRAFFGVQSLKAQVAAYEAAESSTKLALEATQLGYKVGVRVNLDVLNAQTQLYSTQRDLAKARYDVVVNSLKLRQASGQLRAEDLSAVNTLLVK